jgi:hypothetical protein
MLGPTAGRRFLAVMRVSVLLRLGVRFASGGDQKLAKSAENQLSMKVL